MNKTLLVILDGFGLNYNQDQNPVLSAKTPNLDSLIANHPFTTLAASGEEVGLSWGEVGNSEVGHFNLGSGQILWQNLPKIDVSIRDGSFFENQVLLNVMEKVNENSASLHLVGLISDGGIHSHINHLFALLKLAKSQDVEKVYIHMISDGRDTPPKVASSYLTKLQGKIKTIGLGQISTITGRKIAMDRNNNWQLTKKFYDSLVGNNSSNRFESAEAALKEHYSAGKNDENLPSSVIDQSEEQFIKDGDGVIIFNFRADRARQMTRAIGDPNLEEFERANFPNNLELATMTPYEEDWDMEIGVVFDPPEVEHNLAKLISDSGINQVHLAESEKKAHATYFFNGGQEVKYNQELDQIIPSPSVDSFDQKPQMSLEILTQATLDYLKENPYFVLLNVANPDMVGHSGNFEATRIAIEAVDKYLGQILLAASKFNYLSFVTADHGNCEQMINLTTGKADKEHTVNPVPFFWVDNFTKTNKNYEKDKLWQPISTRSPSGVLADVSATVLANLEISPAANMVGEDLRNSLVKL